ncbi:hypothetical protein KIN20_011441 [Parelaphostrongylus tenuis]|uniref:Uncharacterized protein n=1 Tax=Parelaphostrongylus tenuis TaxID=148309 RepID=A0AAD5QJM6_PARTN|nr:hypothetical protein KIN20_011441 [Parelaphostrongylus tenuis]
MRETEMEENNDEAANHKVHGSAMAITLFKCDCKVRIDVNIPQHVNHHTEQFTYQFLWIYCCHCK